LLLLPGCYVITFSKDIAVFNFENATRVTHENFVMRKYFVPDGYMFFVFLFPGHACKEPMKDASIYIKVSSRRGGSSSG